MHWPLQSLPEIQHLSITERDRLISQSFPRSARVFFVLKCLGVGLLTAIAAAILIGVVVDAIGLALDALNRLFLLALPFCCILGFAGCYQVSMLRFRRQLRRYLKEQKRQGQSLPVCLACGYAIAPGIKQCPECGADV